MFESIEPNKWNKWDRKKIDKHGEDEENETWKKCVWMSEMQFIEAYTFGTTDFFLNLSLSLNPKAQNAQESRATSFWCISLIAFDVFLSSIIRNAMRLLLLSYLFRDEQEETFSL